MDNLGIKLENELRRHELKRSYKLSEIKNGAVGDLSIYEHNREFTVDHIISKGVWRFLVIDNTDEQRADGAFLYVFSQATSTEDRLFELDGVRKILCVLSEKKRVIFAYIPITITKREVFKKKSEDVMEVIYPQGSFTDIPWRKGTETLRDKIRSKAGNKDFQQFVDEASVVFYLSEKDEQYMDYHNAVKFCSVVYDFEFYKITPLSYQGERLLETLYDLYVILVLEEDDFFSNEENKANVFQLARSKDVFVVHLPAQESIKTHMDNALKLVQVLETRKTGARCLTRVISMYGASNEADQLSILAIEESLENHVSSYASSSGPASSALSNPSPGAENQDAEIQADVGDLDLENDRILKAALKRDELKRSYKLSEIGDMSTYVHNREFTVDHIISKGVWRFIVIDRTDGERDDGASLYVFNQAGSAEDRFFELDTVRKILCDMSKSKRVIFVYVHTSNIMRREKFEMRSQDVMKVIYPQGSTNGGIQRGSTNGGIPWRKGNPSLIDEIKGLVGARVFQNLLDDAKVVFYKREDDEQYLKYHSALKYSGVIYDLWYYKITHLSAQSERPFEPLYYLCVILISMFDDFFKIEEHKTKVLNLARSRDVFVVHLPPPDYGSVKTHMDGALKVVQLLETRKIGVKCLTRVISMYGGCNEADLLSILAIEEGPARSALSNPIPAAENQAENQADALGVIDSGSGCASLGLPTPLDDENQAAVSNKLLQDDENSADVVDLSSGPPCETTLHEHTVNFQAPGGVEGSTQQYQEMVDVSKKIFDNSVDPNRFGSLSWRKVLTTKSSKFVDCKSWEAFEKKFKAWEASLPKTTSSNSESPFVFGMKMLADASPDSFVTKTEYQGFDIYTFTSEGVTLIRNLLFWMNRKIHQFSFAPDLTTETSHGHIYYDDQCVVVDLAPRLPYKEPIGMPKFRELVEDDIRSLIELITKICGGKSRLPPMSAHLFDAMRDLQSWIENFEYNRNHPVLWCPAKLDSFCQHLKNALWELPWSEVSGLAIELDKDIYSEPDWWEYVSKNIHRLNEHVAFTYCFTYTLSKRLGTEVELPIKARAQPGCYFNCTIGILLWTRELFSHLWPGKREERMILVFNAVMLLFPVYFCQLTWYLFKYGYRSWLDWYDGKNYPKKIAIKDVDATKDKYEGSKRSGWKK